MGENAETRLNKYSSELLDNVAQHMTAKWVRFKRALATRKQATPCPPCVLPQPKTGSYERSPSNSISSKVDALQTLALDVRGGGGGSSEEASVMTLFIRVLVPGFGREKNKDGELDLEGGGLVRRLKRLVSGVLRTMRRSPASAGTEGEKCAKTRSVFDTGSGDCNTRARNYTLRLVLPRRT